MRGRNCAAFCLGTVIVEVHARKPGQDCETVSRRSEHASRSSGSTRPLSLRNAQAAVIFLDTTFLIALVLERDSLHQRAHAWFGALNDRWLVTEYVLWEVVNGLSLPHNRPKAHATATEIRSSGDGELIPASEGLFDAGLQLHAQCTDKEWSLTDCISFHVMRQRGITRALTHDHHFEQAGFEALLRRDP